MSANALEFVIPGDLECATGGYVYDRTMIAGLRGLGWRVGVHGLDGSYPYPSIEANAHAEHVFSELTDDACVLVDGLAFGAMPQIIETHSKRLRIVALIHMPLGSEVGIEPDVAERLRQQEQRALQLARHVIVTSRITERELAGHGIGRSRMTVVEPGVWKSEFAGGPRIRRLERAARAVEGTNPHVIEMLCVASIQPGKGHELLIEALASLAHLPWRLRCVGSLSRSPATVQRLTERVGRLGLSDRVQLIGESSHEALSELYAAADLFVLPTLRESFCMAVAEALAYGLPIIASRTGAIPELAGAGAGLLIEPGDCVGLRAALERALTDSALRAWMRAAASEAGARLTSWPEACERMDRVLEQVCEQEPRAGRSVRHYRMR